MSKNRPPLHPPNSPLRNKSSSLRHHSLRASLRRRPPSGFYYLSCLQILRTLYLEACLGTPPRMWMAVTHSQKVAMKTMMKTLLLLESRCASRTASAAGLSSEKALYSVKTSRPRSRRGGKNEGESLPLPETPTLTTEVLHLYSL